MDNPEKSATVGTYDTGRRQTKQKTMLRAWRRSNKYQFQVIVFGLTRWGLEPTIFCIQYEGSTDDVVGLKLALSIQLG
jgi:hypothetical protein